MGPGLRELAAARVGVGALGEREKPTIVRNSVAHLILHFPFDLRFRPELSDLRP